MGGVHEVKSNVASVVHLKFVGKPEDLRSPQMLINHEQWWLFIPFFLLYCLCLRIYNYIARPGPHNHRLGKYLSLESRVCLTNSFSKWFSGMNNDCIQSFISLKFWLRNIFSLWSWEKKTILNHIHAFIFLSGAGFYVNCYNRGLTQLVSFNQIRRRHLSF